MVVDEFGDEWAVMGQPKQIVELAQYGAEEQGNGDGTPETQVEPGAQNEANKNGNWSNGKVSHLVGPATVQGIETFRPYELPLPGGKASHFRKARVDRVKMHSDGTLAHVRMKSEYRRPKSEVRRQGGLAARRDSASRD